MSTETTVRLHVGQIVEHREDGDRGIVELVIAADSPRLRLPLPCAVGDAVIRLGPGHHRVTSKHREWRVVPDSQQTAVERVRRTLLTWQPPDWVEPGGEPQDLDTLPYALLLAMLPPDRRDRIYEWGGVHTVGEAAVEVAARIDALLERGAA